MRYQGGKSRIAGAIAAKIRELHPTATEIWEPFCGGGAVTLALAKAGFRVHASDSHEDLILMWQALLVGALDMSPVSEAEYAALKKAEPSARRGFAGFGSSFGGGWFAGFARHADGNYDYSQVSRRVLEQLLPFRAQLDFTLADYTAIPDDALAYCDPPYIGTKPYKGSPAFDHVAFWSWVRRRSGPTFVSELTCPHPDITVVWRKEHKSQNASNSPTSRATSQIITREERLYYKPAGCLPDILAVVST